jgi:hypothetical protein
MQQRDPGLSCSLRASTSGTSAALERMMLTLLAEEEVAQAVMKVGVLCHLLPTVWGEGLVCPDCTAVYMWLSVRGVQQCAHFV